MGNKKKRWALFWVTMFFFYMALSTFQLLLSNYYYQGNPTVRFIGGLTDFGPMDFIWTPGWVLGFVLGTIFGHKGLFIGQTITFSIGVIIILGLFNISLKELSDRLDNLIKRGPY